MKKVLVIFGTRPEALKMAPVIKELERHGDKVKTVLVSTAQHRQMLDQVLDIFSIRPDIDLDIMRPNQSLSGITRDVLSGMEGLLKEQRPDMVLVQGDTTTVMAASLAAFYNRVPVGHVEAGLRSFDRFQPYPEEINRRITSSVADLHFAPTARAKENLLREGVAEKDILVTGNTIVDALGDVSKKAGRFAMEGADLDTGRVLLITAHRRENWGEPIREICAAVKAITERFQDVKVVYPVHLNPNVKEDVNRYLSGIARVYLVEPLDYLSFVGLMKQSYLILTDSGGVQEEAPTFGKPVLVLRNLTERPEAFEAGLAKVVGMDADRITEEASRLLEDPSEYSRMVSGVNPYGDGKAAGRIVSGVFDYLGI